MYKVHFVNKYSMPQIPRLFRQCFSVNKNSKQHKKNPKTIKHFSALIKSIFLMGENKEIPVLLIKMLSSKLSTLFRIKLQNMRQSEVPPEVVFSFQSGNRCTSNNFLLQPYCYQKVCPLTESLFIFLFYLTLSSLYGVGWGIKIWFPLVTAAVAD